MVAGFLKLPLLDFEASTDEESIEDLVQLDLVVGLSVVYVAVNVGYPSISDLVGVARISGDGPRLAFSLLLLFVGKSFVEGIDDTAKGLEQNGELGVLGEYDHWSLVSDSSSTDVNRCCSDTGQSQYICNDEWETHRDKKCQRTMRLLVMDAMCVKEAKSDSVG